MKHFQVMVAVLLVAVLCGGCLFSHVRTPLDTDLDRTQLGTKTGEASIHSILWLVAWGDAGTAAAAKEGHIATIRHMDTEIVSILFGAYYRQTVIVYGD